MNTLHLSSGVVHPAPTVVQIWADLHNERAGYYRAFQCADKDASTGCPVFGYCGNVPGSHRTIRAAVAEVRRYYPNERCYRNGREVYSPEVQS